VTVGPISTPGISVAMRSRTSSPGRRCEMSRATLVEPTRRRCPGNLIKRCVVDHRMPRFSSSRSTARDWRRPSASSALHAALHRRPRAGRPDAREHVQLLRGESGLEPILFLPVASSRTLETVAELLVDEDRHRRRALLLEGNHVVARVTLAQNPETWVLDATCRSRRERGAATYRLTRALRRPARCYSTFGPKPPAQRKGRG